MPTTPHIAIIVASTRVNRFADVALNWVIAQTAARADFTFEVLDLRDYQLPYFDLATPPAIAPRDYFSDLHRELGEKLDAADGFLVLTNEYNHGYGAVLKTVLDSYFVEWNRKPISFLGYGNAGGARAIEQLRQVVDELDMASVRPTVNILGPLLMGIRGGGDPTEVLAPLEPRLVALLDDLHWWAIALKNARDADKEATDASDDEA